MYLDTDYNNYWYALEEFSTLPADAVMATTEVGLPAGIDSDRVIIDLAGLNEASIAFNGFDADAVLTRYAPDVIIMPNPDYNELLNSLHRSAIFNEGYDFYEAAELNTIMGLAIRRDSPYYEAMRAIVAAQIRV